MRVDVCFVDKIRKKHHQLTNDEVGNKFASEGKRFLAACSSLPLPAAVP